MKKKRPRHRESLISAHHNYLVNDMLYAGFLIGDPSSSEDFFFLADVVPPGENAPVISCRLFDRQGRLVVEIDRGQIVRNPGGCTLQTSPGGFRVVHPSGDALSVYTQVFTNGYMTRIQGRLYDAAGKVRAEPSHEGLTVHGEMRLLQKTEG